MPVIAKLFKQEPDSHPFRYPVDADRLNIPVRGTNWDTIDSI